jgi:hypothetical protein
MANPINLDTCKIVVWGMKDRYQTHSHIHEGFFRAAQFMRPGSLWLDDLSDKTNLDWNNTLVITNHDVAMHEYLPAQGDGSVFYAIHGLNDDAKTREKFQNVSNRVSWNVFHDFSHVYGTQGNTVTGQSIGVPLTEQVWIGEDVPLYPHERHMDMRWATDLLPHEIQANKPTQLLGQGSNVIWYVGTQWWVNQVELNHWARACKEDGVEFKPTGAGQERTGNRHPLWGIRVATVEENVKLIRESRMAPALSGSHHLTEGYVPCRIFKNVSYGQPYITNNLRAHQVMEKRGIYNPDVYKLYWEAKEKLQAYVKYGMSEVHAQMDLVAEKHTYINRINSLIKAAKIIQGMS